MMAYQFNLDVAGQLQQILSNNQYIIPQFVIEELSKIRERSRGRTRAAAAYALKISAHQPLIIKDIPILKGEKVDDALLRIANILCTNDRELRTKAREKGITVIYLRQKKYLAVDGYIK